MHTEELTMNSIKILIIPIVYYLIFCLIYEVVVIQGYNNSFVIVIFSLLIIPTMAYILKYLININIK